MKVTIWGCRGSLATPGADTLRYGGNGTCIEVRSANNDLVIIDAGTGIRKLGKALIKEDGLKSFRLLLTHAHWDHLAGFPFFIPAYMKHFEIKVRGGPTAQKSLKKFLDKQMEAPYFPVPFSAMQATFDFISEAPVESDMAGMRFMPVPLSHPGGGYGYKFEENGKVFVFLTDNELGMQHADGLTYEGYVEFCKGADVLIHDAQYTDKEYEFTKGWGHTTFAQAADLAVDAGVKEYYIFHHDPDRSDDDLDKQLEWSRERIAAAGSSVRCEAATEGSTIEV